QVLRAVYSRCADFPALVLRQMQNARLRVRPQTHQPHAASEAGLLESAEGDVWRGATVRVDPDRAGIEATRDLRRALRIATPYRCAQSETGGVRAGHCRLVLGECQ